MSADQSRRWPVFLIASLVLNGLLLGFVLGTGFGRTIHGDPELVPTHRGGVSMMRAIGDVSTQSERSAIRSALRQVFAETREQRGLQRLARQSLAQAITAEPYDEERVRSAFEALRQADATLETRMHEELSRQLGELSPSQREAIARSMQHHHGLRGLGSERPR